METNVNCPNCETPHKTIASGHRNIVCTSCRTEFSVLTKNGRVRSVSKVLRPRPIVANTQRATQRTPPKLPTIPNLNKIIFGIALFVLAFFLYRWLRFGGIVAILLGLAIYYRFFRKPKEENNGI